MRNPSIAAPKFDDTGLPDMPLRLDISKPQFNAEFDRLLHTKREVSRDVNDAVAAILHAVAEKGDRAVIAYTEQFDRIALTPDKLRISEAEIEDAIARCD
ncbi:MAG TPA: hypothetical protein DDW95_00250, partial [Alphaproteobacteria bacterium]|nr:hypothetical protein [Alphaproteobacteria bacterium]